MEQIAPLVQVSPEILDKLDADQIIDELAQRMGVPASIIRSDEEVKAIRQSRAEQQASEQAAARQQAEAEQLARLGSVRTEGTVAGAVLGSKGNV